MDGHHAAESAVETPEGLRHFELCEEFGDLVNPQWAAPPAADRCLVFSYASRGRNGQKGGTLIDGSVLDLATHEARMKDPASYRPAECRCGGNRLHLHDLRDRIARGTAAGAGGFAVVTVVVFLCASCSATWRVLPAFLARCLWRTWTVVAAVLFGQRRPDQPKVPPRTRQRWRARLAQSARVAAQVLATSGDGTLRGLAQRVGLDGCRQSLAEGHAAVFAGAALLAPLAELLHRLTPGIRLM
jgi:hypothetical protein